MNNLTFCSPCGFFCFTFCCNWELVSKYVFFWVNSRDDWNYFAWVAVDRSQEKGLIWWPCWGWKNMGESNFHYENGPPQTKMHSNVWKQMPRVQEHLAELIFVHFSGRGNWYSKGHLSVWTTCCKMYKAALPIYRNTYAFRAFPGINHKTIWNESFLKALFLQFNN